MKTYDNPDRRTYNLGNVDYAGGAVVNFAISGPAGKKGRLVAAAVTITEATVGTTTTPKLVAGTSGGDASYMTLDLGTSTALTTVVSNDTDTGALATFVSGTDTGNTEIPADGTLYLETVLAVGGTITGQGETLVTVDWY